jgi:site-specific recombinase XerD
MGDPVPKGFVGSNPTPSTVPTVRIPIVQEIQTNNKGRNSGQEPKVLLERYKTVPSDSESRNRMRDIYNRKKKLSDWIEKVNTDLDRSDRTDVLKFVEYMNDNANAILWITRCITALISMRRFMRKPYRDANKEDIRALLDIIENQKNYKPATIEKYKIILRLFYKVVYGSSKFYPEQVNWFSIKVSKDMSRDTFTLNMAEYLDEDEIRNLIVSSSSLQRKAIIACMYETGARPEEFLNLQNTDINVNSKGAVFILRGKTVERRVLTVSFTKYLEQWLEIHPLRSQDIFPLWVSEATNYQNRPLSLGGLNKVVKDAFANSGIKNKHARAYILRHSRATHLANHGMEQAQLCKMFGWSPNSKIPSRYIHMSGIHLDDAIISLSEGGKVQPQEYKLKTITCTRCSEKISPGANYCFRCALPVSLIEDYKHEMDLKEENRILKERIDLMQEKMTAIQESQKEITDLLKEPEKLMAILSQE